MFNNKNLEYTLLEATLKKINTLVQATLDQAQENYAMARLQHQTKYFFLLYMLCFVLELVFLVMGLQFGIPLVCSSAVFLLAQIGITAYIIKSGGLIQHESATLKLIQNRATVDVIRKVHNLLVYESRQYLPHQIEIRVQKEGQWIGVYDVGHVENIGAQVASALDSSNSSNSQGKAQIRRQVSLRRNSTRTKTTKSRIIQINRISTGSQKQSGSVLGTNSISSGKVSNVI